MVTLINVAVLSLQPTHSLQGTGQRQRGPLQQKLPSQKRPIGLSTEQAASSGSVTRRKYAGTLSQRMVFEPWGR
jgi:hypothetical protein